LPTLATPYLVQPHIIIRDTLAPPALLLSLQVRTAPHRTASKATP